MELALAPQKTSVVTKNAFEGRLKSEFGVDFDGLQAAIGILPHNYSFEVEKTICRIFEIRKTGQHVRKVSL
jgi:hypothetical protein